MKIALIFWQKKPLHARAIDLIFRPRKLARSCYRSRENARRVPLRAFARLRLHTAAHCAKESTGSHFID
jgi:hypothetical protein